MKTLWISTFILLLAAVPGASDDHAAAKPPAALPVDSSYHGFPDFGHMISPDQFAAEYPDTPIFHLKTDYPGSKPLSSEMPPFIGIDFTRDWEAYMRGVQAYCFDGNLPSWDPYANTVRGWYHIPWLHPVSTTGYPPNGGTEGFHGLIKEAEVDPYQLAPEQLGSYQVYAVTLVNDFGGYTLGEMWKDPDNPNPKATDKRWGGGFLEGTVFCKLLFTDAPQGDDKVPFLENPLEWQAYITKTWDSPERDVLPVHLLQMDIMVRDPNADRFTGWVLGTFVYNGQLGHTDNRFMNLVPLGLQWGNDPDVTDNVINPYPPLETKTSDKLEQTVINPSKDVPPQHLGWGYRLNGPADLNTSSCMSCHMASAYPALVSLVAPGMVPPGPVPPSQGGSPEWMEWFQNVECGTSRDPEAYSTDMSLQVAISLQNFRDVKNANAQGFWAEEYRIHPLTRDGVPRAAPASER